MFIKEKYIRHPVQKNKKWQKQVVRKSAATINGSFNHSSNIFKVIFSLFCFAGIDVLSHTKNTDHDFPKNLGKSLKHHLILVIQKCCKYTVFIGLGAKFLFGIVLSHYQEDKTKCFTHSFIALLTLFFYASVDSKRQMMSPITESLCHSMRKIMDCTPKVKTQGLIALFFTMQILMIIWMALRYLTESYIDAIQNTVSDSWKTTMYCFNLFLGIMFTFVSVVPCIVLSLFAFYYILTCKCIQILLEHVLERTGGDFFPDDMETLLVAYGDIARYTRSADEHLSLPVFLSVSFTMTGLFWGGYRIAFNSDSTQNYFISLIIPQIFYLSIQLLVMTSAAITNELANKVKSVMQCLPYCNLNPVRSYKFKKDLKQDACLTLWKIYVMDRSLVITSIGTLLTYGILLGTLGNT